MIRNFYKNSNKIQAPRPGELNLYVFVDERGVGANPVECRHRTLKLGVVTDNVLRMENVNTRVVTKTKITLGKQLTLMFVLDWNG